MKWIVLEVLNNNTFKTYTMDSFEEALSIFMNDKEKDDRKCCLLPEDIEIPKNFIPGNLYINEKIK